MQDNQDDAYREGYEDGACSLPFLFQVADGFSNEKEEEETIAAGTMEANDRRGVEWTTEAASCFRVERSASLHFSEGDVMVRGQLI